MKPLFRVVGLWSGVPYDLQSLERHDACGEVQWCETTVIRQVDLCSRAEGQEVIAWSGHEEGGYKSVVILDEHLDGVSVCLGGGLVESLCRVPGGRVVQLLLL